ncbi:MAG: glycosyltransferase [Pedobacter sp.]|nr:MAG: glycosyltransferase [Pedobacter sp.]
MVFYTLGSENQTDQGFIQNIIWDIPLLEGYQYEFIENVSKNPGSHHYKGIINPDLISKINAFKPDVLLIYGWAYSSHLKVMRYFHRKIPLWFRGDSTLMDRQPYWKKLVRKFSLAMVYKNVDLAFYVGQQNLGYFRAAGLSKKQLIFAPHAVDNHRFGKDRFHEAQIFRNKLGILDGEILVLFAGKLERKKSPDLLLQAFLELNTDDAHLLFVGNGELEEYLKRVVKSFTNPPPAPSKGGQNSPTKERIHFVDFKNQSEMPVIYQACDLFCLPSKGPGETWGLAVNEAMAAGKAVLISDRVGCGADLVEDGKNGYIYKSQDENDLLTKLKILVDDQPTLAEMGKRSAEKIKQWSFKLQVEAIMEAVNKL